MVNKVIFLIISILAFQSLLAQPDVGMKLSLAQSYEQASDFENAAKIYETLYEADPQNMLYTNSLYRVYTQTKNYAALVNVLENRIKDVPDDVSSYGMLGSTYHRMGNEARASEVWEMPLKNEKDNALTYRLIADYALERRAFEKAIDLYSRGKAIAGDKIIFSFDLARLYTLTMQYDEATEEYCFILQNEPKQMTTVESRIFEYIGKPGALDASISVVENFSDDGNLSMQYLLARLYTEKKLFEDALDIYLMIDESNSNQGKDLFAYADRLLKEKDFQFASEVYQKIIELYPNSQLTAQAKLGYARSLESELFDEYVKSIPLWKPFFPLTKFESRKTEDVLSAFDEVVRLYNHSEPSYEALLRSGIINFYLQNEIEQAKRLLNVVSNEAQLSRSAADAFLELGNIALIEGNLVEADKNYSAVLNNDRTPMDKKNNASYKLARLYFYQLKFDKAKEQLSKVLMNLKDNSANDALELSLILNSTMNDSTNIALFAEAEFLAEKKNFSEAADIYRRIADNPMAFVLHSISSLRIGEMMLADNNYADAITTLESVTEEGEQNIYSDKAVYLLAKIHQFGLNDLINAQEYYQKLLSDFPNSIYLDEAREQLKSLLNKPS
ncbi:MAG: tetratricopeptide repeat protein [Ignavibacteria bacterium]|nr:tetratricopeptide repeat protein [Ignavibacteria bacterium]MBT8390789.1 tetratricopeptide repeat protein [Ignavibacteria bacterium]NNJ52890.1 tetratricopeptide repeat protein [Ignavibacteriaceae bacterium]NNL20161.1 tetratricopeptide repeat protein [Ignavibacteriaceae bacterium]